MVIKKSRYTSSVEWEDGIVRAKFRKDNGKEHCLFREGVLIEDAEKVGDELITELKKLYM